MLVKNETLQLTSGAKSVSLETTGHENVMASVCLTAKADGTKLKPMIVFRGAKRETKALAEPVADPEGCPGGPDPPLVFKVPL